MLPGVGYQELVVLLIVAVLLFGSRLPSVLQDLGRSYAKLKKGLADIQNSFDQPVEDSSNDYFDSGPGDEDEPYESPFAPETTAPKFSLPEESSPAEPEEPSPANDEKPEEKAD